MGTSDGYIEGILEIMGANTTGVTSMFCSMCNCVDLTSVALFDTSSVTDMSYMLSGCTKVQSGALALYQHASTQANPPTEHGGANTLWYAQLALCDSCKWTEDFEVPKVAY